MNLASQKGTHIFDVQICIIELILKRPICVFTLNNFQLNQLSDHFPNARFVDSLKYIGVGCLMQRNAMQIAQIERLLGGTVLLLRFFFNYNYKLFCSIKFP